uniref:Methyltransferase small domain-containing protein n=1 Tax=Populus alba TaxID=43335 RepID=A0A4U5NLV1_POPAL|nr:hypothetical protein D5086_0000256670 [Populus alba]
MSPKTAQIRLVSSHPEVYEPCDDSFALVDALLADRTNILDHCPRLCLEVGCGSGYVIASLALMLGQELPGVYYFATDINPHALRVTRETLDAHAVDAELMCMDIASGLEKRLAGMVDVMVVNPPYVPTPDYEVGREGIASAWAGGENGRSVIDRILPVADRLLSDKGWLYMVTLTTNDPSQICLLMRKRGTHSFHSFLNCHSGEVPTAIVYETEGKLIRSQVTLHLRRPFLHSRVITQVRNPRFDLVSEFMDLIVEKPHKSPLSATWLLEDFFSFTDTRT